MRSVLTSCHLSKYASHFESEGYDVVQFLLDATESELAAVFAVMKEFERRRVLRAIGIPAAGLHASPAPPEADETAETSEQSAPTQVIPLPSVVPTGNSSAWLLWSSPAHPPIGFSCRNGHIMFMATKASRHATSCAIARCRMLGSMRSGHRWHYT